MASDPNILFFGKRGDEHCQRAATLVKQQFPNSEVHLGEWGDPLPEESKHWRGDYIISYLSRWRIPEALLDRARIAAINFHPAPPEYPGIGCCNFALYENARQYGATCHHMAAAVDTGQIISVSRIPVYPSDDVASLLTRTYDAQFSLFEEIIYKLIEGSPLPCSQESWARRPFTRKELDELSTITPNMPDDEIERRIRATSYGDFQPRVIIAGHTFKLTQSNRDQ